MLGFLNLSMTKATQRFMNYYEGKGDNEKKKEIFNISIVLHIVVAIILVILLLITGSFLFNGILNIPSNRIEAAIIVYGSLIVSTAFSVITVPYDAVLNSHENMRYYAIIGILESLLKLMVAFVVVYVLMDKLIVYGILMASIPFVTLSIMRLYCHKHYSECVFAPIRYWEKDTALDMAKFAGWNFYGCFSVLVGNYGNGLVMNHFYGVTLNAATGVATRLCAQLNTFSNTMQKALNPAITISEGEGNRKKMLELSTSGCKFSFALLAVVAIPFIIEMPYIQELWLVNVPKWAVLFAQLQIVRVLIELLTLPYSQSILSEGRVAGYNITISVMNLVPVVCLFLLFRNGYPPITMYILNISIFGILISFVRLFYAHKNCGLSYMIFVKEVFLPILIVFAGSYVITLLPQYYLDSGFIRLILSLIIGVMSFSLLFWFFVLSKNEKELLIESLVKIKNKISRHGFE